MNDDKPATRPLVFIHSDLDDRTDITPNALRVYMHLARRAGSDGTAWPSYQAIGDHCFAAVSENKSTRKTFARKAIDELIDAGLIAKESRRKDDGALTSNSYRIIDGYGCANFSQPEADPMPIDTPMPIYADPMPNEQTLCLSSTKDYPIEVNPIEENTHSRAETAGSPKRRGKMLVLDSPYMPKGMQLPRGYVPRGTGENPVQVYYERFSPGSEHERLTAPQEDDLARLCPDLDRLRNVVTAYANSGFKNARNVQLILDWYRQGIPAHKPPNRSKRHASNQRSSEPVHRTAPVEKPTVVIDAAFKEQLRRARGYEPKPVPGLDGAIALA